MENEQLRQMMDDARCHVKTAMDLIASRGSFTGVTEVLQLVKAEVLIMPSLLSKVENEQQRKSATTEVTTISKLLRRLYDCFVSNFISCSYLLHITEQQSF